MRIVDVARTLLLLLCGFAAGATLGAGPIKEVVPCVAAVLPPLSHTPLGGMMQELNVMQITRVKLRPEAADVLTANAHAEVVSWLSQWTPQANFKAVVTRSSAESLHILTEDLLANLVPCFMRGKVKASMFTFQVSSQMTQNGRFWMPSALSTCIDYPIPEA